MKMYKSYFKDRMLSKCNIPFHTDTKVEDKYIAAIPYSQEDLIKLEKQYGTSYWSMHREIQHIVIQSYPDIAYAIY